MKKITWVMPEKRDEEFSESMLTKMAITAAGLKIFNFGLEISEKYEDEHTPHYHMFSIIGQDEKFSKLLQKEESRRYALCGQVQVKYAASTDDEKKFVGFARVRFYAETLSDVNKILASLAWGLYDESIREYYPEWKTTYDLETFSVSCANYRGD